MIQKLIEKYYPNYSGCDNIALEGDLHKILFDKGSIDDGDCADHLLKQYTQEDHDNNQVLIDWQEERIKILETTLEIIGEELERTIAHIMILKNFR